MKQTKSLKTEDDYIILRDNSTRPKIYIGDAQRPSFVQGQQNQGFGNKITSSQLFEVNPKKNRY